MSMRKFEIPFLFINQLKVILLLALELILDFAMIQMNDISPMADSKDERWLACSKMYNAIELLMHDFC